jgi:hypothetical protein
LNAHVFLNRNQSSELYALFKRICHVRFVAVAVRGLASVDTAEPTPPHAPFVVVFTAAVRKLVRRRVSSVRVRVRVRVGLGRVSSIPCAALVTKWHSYGVDSAESQS